MGDILKSVKSGELKIGNCILKVHVLDDGQRVFEAESFEIFWESMMNSEKEMTEEEAMSLAKFCKGQD